MGLIIYLVYPWRHRLASAVAAWLVVGSAAAQAQEGRCPPEAASAVERGWKAMRTDSIPQAEEEFGRADRLCRGNLDAKVGLGYVALRSDRVRQADSLFRIVVHRDSANADAWEGLALAAARTGDRQRAVVNVCIWPIVCPCLHSRRRRL